MLMLFFCHNVLIEFFQNSSFRLDIVKCSKWKKLFASESATSTFNSNGEEGLAYKSELSIRPYTKKYLLCCNHCAVQQA